jgi:hypothetical protein
MQQVAPSRFGLLVLVLLALLLPTALPARAQGGDLDVGVFYQELEPYGRWFSHPRYGYVWSPNVDEDWRPYSRGHWTYTDDSGWYWEAEEPWGWGPFHYGRWIFDEEAGWVWIPGTEWGPAWVAWRYSDEYVGWAPLPPEAEWYEDRGLAFSASYYDGPRFAPFWIFVAPRYMVMPGCYRYALAPSRNYIAIRSTRWGTDYRRGGRGIFNVGFDVRRFERVTGRPLTRVRLIGADSPRGLGFRPGDRTSLHVYRPQLRVGINPGPPPRLGDPPRREWRDRAVVRPGLTPHDKGSSGGQQFGQPQPNWKQPNDRGPSNRALQDHGQTGQQWKGPQTGSGQPPPNQQFRRQDTPQQWRQPQAGGQPQHQGQGGGQPQYKIQGQPPPKQFGQQPPPQQQQRSNQGQGKQQDPNAPGGALGR